METSEYKQFLGRSKQNIHIEHFEDEIFNRGPESVKDMLSKIKNFNYKVSVKYDGSPSIVCGKDPMDNRFFVGTKAAFSKKPTLIKDDKDLDQIKDKKLRHKLSECFCYLSKLNLNSVYQGDMLYTLDSLKFKCIRDKKYITFTPNTLVYGIEEGTKEYAKILSSKLGIVFHTEYRGNMLYDMYPNFEPDLNFYHKDIFMVDPKIKGDIKGFNTTFIEKLIQSINNKDMLSMMDYFNKFASKMLFVRPKSFYNKLIKQGIELNNTTIDLFVREYFKHLLEEYNRKIFPNLKSKRGKKNRREELFGIFKYVKENEELFKSFLEVKSFLVSFKRIIMWYLESLNQTKIQCINERNNFINGEGFVLVDNETNQPIKLVNRIEFSNRNFNLKKDWE